MMHRLYRVLSAETVIKECQLVRFTPKGGPLHGSNSLDYFVGLTNEHRRDQRRFEGMVRAI